MNKDDLERIQDLKERMYGLATASGPPETKIEAAKAYAELVKAEVAARRYALKKTGVQK